MSTFDFVSFVETFVERYECNKLFPNHTVFSKPATRLGKQGRASGGLLCFIRTDILHFVRVIDVDNDNFLCFLLKRSLFGLDKDVLFLCSYIPPENSPFYASDANPFDNGLEILEDVLLKTYLEKDNVYILIAGDLNSRTKDLVPDLLAHESSFPFSLHEDRRNDVHRCSQDKTLNSYGKKLLDLCSSFGLCMLNGISKGDEEGSFTYITDCGCSVNDYILVSCDLLPFMLNGSFIHVAERSDSDHLPIEMYIPSTHENKSLPDNEISTKYCDKYVWNGRAADKFIDGMNSVQGRSALQHATDLINADINESLHVFNDFIRNQAECMKKRTYINKRHNSHKWFDRECISTRKHVRKLLCRFRKTHVKEDRNAYCKARREYKNLITKKQKDFQSYILDKLICAVDDPQSFWDTLRMIAPKKCTVVNSISVDEWFQHFTKLLDIPDDRHSCFDNLVNNGDSNDPGEWFNEPITKSEVLHVLSKLKNSKAPGQDLVIGELLKYSSHIITDFLVNFFNALFLNGVYPEQWSESITFPLFKKGEANDPNNYRGITLCDISSKVYSAVINNRLRKWIEENNTTGEQQAGFKKYYSTIDHIFTLMAAVQKQLLHNRKLYVAFIDFEKAFDSISRKLLWPILIKNGITGNLFRCIKSMYENVKTKVKCGADFTDFITCTRGVKQGDVCSPILFSLFINELALDIIGNGKHGITFIPSSVELFLLLFADDIVLLSETAVGLQTQLNSLFNAASRLELKVNMSKSNVMVFRKGGHLASYERWTYGDKYISVVNSYKYLGIYFSTKLSANLLFNDLVCRGKKALFCIMSNLRKLNNNSLDVFIKLFDAQVQPVLQYGAEIWAFEKAALAIERVHTFALKRFLRINLRAPNDCLYGDFGRFPIYINSYIRCISYWLKITRMPDDRLPAQAYKMLLRLDKKGKLSWASNIRKILNTYGFTYVWHNQGVGCITSFLKSFKQRIIDCRWQDWEEHVNTSDRFHIYRSLKYNHEVEPYLKLGMHVVVKNCLAKLRFGISPLLIHSERYKKNPNVKCPVCFLSDEDEVHFILKCSAYHDLRAKYIPQKYFTFPCLNRLNILLASTHETTMRNLCIYLHHAFRRREVITS